MKRIQKMAALGVLSLILTIMTVLTLITEPPEANGAESGGEAEVMAANDSAEATQSPETEPQATVKQYILKDVSGFIGIFDPNTPDTPQMITGIIVSKLRSADAVSLRTGILVTGEDELAKLLEDFGS